MNSKLVKFKNEVLFELLKFEDIYKRKDFIKNHNTFHQVDFYIILIITKNKSDHQIDFESYLLEPKSIVMIRKDQIHRFLNNKLEGYLLLFTEEFLINTFGEEEGLKSLQLFNNLVGYPKLLLEEEKFNEVLGMVSEMREEHKNGRDVFSVSVIRSMLQILLIKLFREKFNKKNYTISKKYTSEFIRFQNLIEQKVFLTRKVKDYGSLMGTSTKTLNTITHTVVHKSAKSFINEIFLRKLKLMLKAAVLSPKEIAYEAGFEDYPNFLTFFKKHVGNTPSNFQKAYKVK